MSLTSAIFTTKLSALVEGSWSSSQGRTHITKYADSV